MTPAQERQAEYRARMVARKHGPFRTRWSSVMRTTKNQVNEDRIEVLWLNPIAARQVALPLEFEVSA